MTSDHAEPMTTADSAWLQMDRADNRMVIQVLMRSSARVDGAKLTESLRERWVDPFPRFRQHVEPRRIGLREHPHWVESLAFDIAHHVRQVKLPSPGDESSLRRYVSEQAGLRLERTRPLWEVQVLDGFGAGSAVLFRVHHAMADGHVLTQLLLALDESQPPRSEYPAGSDSARAAERRGLFERWFVRPMAWLSQPGDVASLVSELASIGSVAAFAPPGMRALRAGLSGRKDLGWHPPLDLAELKRCCHAHGVTLNDFWLGALAGGLRAYLDRTGSRPEEVRAVVPVDLRDPSAELDRMLGNRFGLAFASLPVGEPSRQARLAAVKRAMDRVKRSGEARITFDWLRASSVASESLGANWIEPFTRYCSAVVSNVIGPRQPLVLGGVPNEALTPWVPTTGPIGLGVCVSSYAGTIHFGIASDRSVIQHPEALLDCIREEALELRKPRGAQLSA